jgi:hypothetical protein
MDGRAEVVFVTEDQEVEADYVGKYEDLLWREEEQIICHIYAQTPLAPLQGKQKKYTLHKKSAFHHRLTDEFTMGPLRLLIGSSSGLPVWTMYLCGGRRSCVTVVTLQFESKYYTSNWHGVKPINYIKD